MRKIIYTLVLLAISLTASLGQGFITTWEVTAGDLTIAIPTTGAGYNYSVNWGDGVSQTGFTGNASHTYAAAGIYTVHIQGSFPRIYFNFSNTGGDRNQIKTIEQWGNIAWTSMARAFAGCSQLTYNATDTPNLSGVTDMEFMFANAVNFNGAINSWNISNVTNLGNMFENAQKFNQPLNGWNTSNVQNMAYMFWKAFKFNQDIGSWNLASVLNMSNMFREASAFNQNIGGWNTSNVILADAMFMSATSFNQDISAWDVSHIVRFASMFAGATSFNQNISAWNVTGANSLSAMFSGATAFNQNISGWNVSSITNFSLAFNGATSFNQNLGTWAIGNATNMASMFNNSGLSLSNYDNTIMGWAALPSVQPNITLGATGVKYCDAVDARTALITNFNWTFSGDIPDCPSFNTTWLTGAPGESVIIPTIGTGYDYYVDWGDGTVDFNVTGNASHNYATPGTHTIKIYGDFPRIYFNSGGHLSKIRTIERWGGNQWTSMENAFYGCFNLVNNATDAPDLSQVTSLAGMFRNASNFDADLGDWDVSTITDMSNMLDNTRMSYFNYDQTINSWAANPSLQNNVTLGAAGVPYCEAARATLISSKNWNFVGDKKGCPFISTWETTPSKQVTIPVTGSGYKYYVEWGDGAITFHNNSTSAVHTYATTGTYTVRVSGNFPRFNGVAYANPYIQTIEAWGDIEWSSMFRAFKGCTSLVSNATDAPDLSNVTILSEMFSDATSFNGDLSNWDVSNVTSMLATFNNAESFNGDVSTWDVSNVTNMSAMFANARAFNSDISGWDVSNVTTMKHMLYQAAPFNHDLSGWNVSNVTNMSYMLSGLDNFNQPIGSWDVSKVLDMSGLFSGSPAFNQPLNSWNVSLVQDMSDMFNGAEAFNQPLQNWNVGSVTSFSNMFYEATSFNQPIGNWNLSNATDLYAMFYGATAFNQDISGWDFSNGPDIYEMFYGATSFNQDISGWNVSLVTNLESMFTGATSFDQNLGAWDVSNVEYMDNMFDNSGMSRPNYDQTLIGWNTLSSLQDDVSVGANGLRYCKANTAHAQLIANHNWTFTGDLLDCANNAPTDIALSNNSVHSNNNIGGIVGLFTTNDADVNDTFTYSLVAGSGDSDNASFSIDGDKLMAAEIFNHLVKSSYSIRVRTDDWINTFEKVFIITITEQDLIPPSVVTLSPPHNATGVAVNVTLKVTYDDVLVAGSGVAVVKKANGTVVASIDISQATLNVNELSFTLPGALDRGTTYSVSIPGSYVKDANENFALAIDGGWMFTTIGENQEITFDPIEDQFLEKSVITLSAVATSGLPVTYEIIEGPASVSGSTLTFGGVGSVTIRASQAGNSSFLPAAPKDQTFQIISVTGLDAETTRLVIFPNPASDYLVVETLQKDTRIQLMSINGSQSMEIKPNERNDISQLGNGLYLLRISGPGGASIHKIIKN